MYYDARSTKHSVWQQYVADKGFEPLFLYERSQTVFLFRIQIIVTQDNPGLIQFPQETNSIVS
jgi:hypothetical protein